MGNSLWRLPAASYWFTPISAAHRGSLYPNAVPWARSFVLRVRTKTPGGGAVQCAPRLAFRALCSKMSTLPTHFLAATPFLCPTMSSRRFSCVFISLLSRTHPPRSTQTKRAPQTTAGVAASAQPHLESYPALCNGVSGGAAGGGLRGPPASRVLQSQRSEDGAQQRAHRPRVAAEHAGRGAGLAGDRVCVLPRPGPCPAPAPLS